MAINLHDPRVIGLINDLNLHFQACPPLVGRNAPKKHHWGPNTTAENIPLEDCTFYFIEEVTHEIAKSYQDLVRRLKLKPNCIKGYLWAVLSAQKWGSLVIKNRIISPFEICEFIIKLSIYLVFSKYKIIHGNITGLHVYIVKCRKPILMTPTRFVPRPQGSELIRAWCWYIARGHEDSDKFIKLLKEHKNKLLVKLWLLGAIFDFINDPEYYRGDTKDIASLWREI